MQVIFIGCNTEKNWFWNCGGVRNFLGTPSAMLWLNELIWSLRKQRDIEKKQIFFIISKFKKSCQQCWNTVFSLGFEILKTYEETENI